MQTAGQQKNSLIILCAIATVVGLFLYNPLPLYFLNDDFIHIPLSGSGALFQRNSFRPICDWSVQLDYFIWGKTAWGYHLTNLLLHIFDSILVFFFVKQLCKTCKIEKAFQLALPTATLFFIYAFHSEAVFWIIGRSAALGVLFFLPACIFYLKRNESNKYFIASLLFYIVGLLTYESVWIFPLFAATIHIFELQPSIKKKEWGWLSIILFAFCLYALARYITIGEIVGAYESTAFLSFDFIKMGVVFGKLLSRTFVPPNVSSLHFMASIFIGGLLLILAVIALRRKLKKEILLKLVLVMIFISILPYLSLGVDTHTVEGERFLYMPTLFASIFLVRIIMLFFDQKSFSPFLLAGLFGYHLYFLSNAGNAYKTAGLIAKTTFNNINELRQKNLLVIDSLPQSYKGALIFRSGFAEGVQWLKNPGTVDSVMIHSIKEINGNWTNNFKTKKMEALQPIEINYFLQKKVEIAGFEKVQIPTKELNKHNDALFIFSDSTLKVFK